MWVRLPPSPHNIFDYGYVYPDAAIVFFLQYLTPYALVSFKEQNIQFLHNQTVDMQAAA